MFYWAEALTFDMPEFRNSFNLRKQLAELAMFVFLITVAPVYAMSRIEGRELERAAIVQVINPRQRNRALARRNRNYMMYETYTLRP